MVLVTAQESTKAVSAATYRLGLCGHVTIGDVPHRQV